jgi:hypothetical protein
LYKKPPSEDLDSISSDADEAVALYFSLTALERAVERNKALSEAALDNSLSSFASLPSLAEPKGSSKGNRNNSLSSIVDEDGSNLLDGSEEVNPLRSLSPSQFVGSLMKRSGSKEKLLVQTALAPTGTWALPLSFFPQLFLCRRIKQQTKKQKQMTMLISG